MVATALAHSARSEFAGMFFFIVYKVDGSHQLTGKILHFNCLLTALKLHKNCLFTPHKLLVIQYVILLLFFWDMGTNTRPQPRPPHIVTKTSVGRRAKITARPTKNSVRTIRP